MWLSALAVVLGLSASNATAAPYLGLGDSYTIGEGVEAPVRWPNQLADMLRKSGIDVGEPEIVAKTGWTTDELSAAMDAHTFSPPYRLVTLLIGVNNQYRGRDAENYRGEFQKMLERAIGLAGGDPKKVVVVSIPDWGVTKFGKESGRDTAEIARQLDAYNAINAQIAKMLHCGYVDVTAVSRQSGNEPAMLVSDGLHPSAKMYTEWAQRIFPVARAALSQH